MSPDPRDRRKRNMPKAKRPPVRVRPSPDDPHDIVYFRRHRKDDPIGAEPGREALNSYPPKVKATMRAALAAVADAPPKRFAGGGYWEAMKGDMTGWFELRVDGPGRHHYRLFCLLDMTRGERTSRCWLSSMVATSHSGPRCRRPTTRPFAVLGRST